MRNAINWWGLSTRVALKKLQTFNNVHIALNHFFIILKLFHVKERSMYKGFWFHYVMQCMMISSKIVRTHCRARVKVDTVWNQYTCRLSSSFACKYRAIPFMTRKWLHLLVLWYLSHTCKSCNALFFLALQYL